MIQDLRFTVSDLKPNVQTIKYKLMILVVPLERRDGSAVHIIVPGSNLCRLVELRLVVNVKICVGCEHTTEQRRRA